MPGEINEFPLVAKARERGVFDRKCAFISAPTGTGKSWLGQEILSHYLDHKPGGTVNTYLVPYRALAEEVFESLKKRCGGRFTVRIATGDYKDPIEFSKTDVLVATYEKFLALLHRRSEANPYVPFVVIMDEFHLVGEPSRGPRVEAVISRILTSKIDVLFYPLSAVVGNPNLITEWLETDWVEGKEQDRVVKVTYRRFRAMFSKRRLSTTRNCSAWWKRSAEYSTFISISRGSKTEKSWPKPSGG
jgi:helicase